MNTATRILSLGAVWVSACTLQTNEAEIAQVTSSLSFEQMQIQTGQTEGVGRIGGTFSVGPAGQATYEIPFSVPPGRQGMSPQLGISYDSLRGHGAVGRGWYLAGLSRISRCYRNRETEAGRHGLIANDGFCLDGMELVQVGTSIDGDVYRTVPDEHMEITRLSDGLAAWRVRTKTGRVSYYGASPESRVAASMFAGFSEVVAWDLSRVEDKHGNHVSFLYDSFVNGTEFGGTREHYLAEVRYTGHAEQEGIRFVRFNYRPRADVTKGYVRWVPVRISRLLQSIEMHAPDGTRRSVAGDPVPVVRAVRRYNLSYLDLASHRASLVGLEECVLPTSGASVCKPTVEFDYSHHTSLDFPSDGADPVEFANLVYNDTTAHAPANAGDIDGIPGEELLQMRGSEPLVLRISRDRERQDRGIVNAEIAGL